MELQLYFYHHEINMSPELIFETINDDTKLINSIGKLKEIEYKNADSNTREVGTKGALQYGDATLDSEIIQYSSDRRIEVKSKIPAGTLVTMFNVVPVEDRSEVTISTKLYTESPVSFALYALKIPRIRKRFNTYMERFSQNQRINALIER